MTRSRDSARGGILGILSTRPVERWPDGVVHHGGRVLLLVSLATLVTLFFPPDSRLSVARYEEGMVAEADVIAEIPFSVPKSTEELERDRAEAAAAVPPIFVHRPEASDSMAARLTRFFARADSAARAPDPVEAVQELLIRSGISSSPVQARLLADDRAREQVREAALAAARRILPRGVVDASQPQLFTAGRVTVRREGGAEIQVPRDSLLLPREFFNEAAALLPRNGSTQVEELLRLVLIQFLAPTYVLDVAATEEDRENARRAVPTTKATILQGEAIVRANQAVGPAEVERLTAYYDQLRSRGVLSERGVRAGPLLGSLLLNVLILGIYGLLLLFYRPEVYSDFRRILLQAILVAAYFGVAGLVARHDLPTELLPVTFPALAAAVLWDSRMALVLGLIVGVATGAQAPFAEFGVLLTTLVGGAAAALSVRAVRRRAQTWVFVSFISGAYAAVLVALGLVLGWGGWEVAERIAWAVGNATVSAILAMGFIPLFEWFTGITTDQTLLEWADPNRPLLKRLSLEAPGTYAHSINVANLSEAAANAIGANGLLCRVGVYYHDVGKILKPQYFVENQPGGRNPHDLLKPATSAAIVREHVVEGLRLAREARVPPVLQDFIPEHHGTQLIQYFWDRAREEAGGSTELDPEAFRYPGPKPRSRETAIVMLADAVESAARVLQDPTPERIRELIDQLVEARIRDGQLDEAPLTLAELTAIKGQFAKVLGGMYHHRVDYPSTRHLTRAGGGGGGGAGAPAAPPMAVPPEATGPAAEGGVEARSAAPGEGPGPGGLEEPPHGTDPDLFGGASPGPAPAARAGAPAPRGERRERG